MVTLLRCAIHVCAPVWRGFRPVTQDDRRTRRRGRAAMSLLLGLLLVGCRQTGEPPTPDSVPAPDSAPGEALPEAGGGPGSVPEDELPIVLGDFFAGATALQVGDSDSARAKLEATVAAAPNEPAAWANLAIARLRGNAPDREAAEVAMDEARRLAPEDDGVAVIDAAVLARLGRLDEARDALGRAVEVAPDNLRARFALFEALDAAGEDEAAARELAALRSRVPNNLAAAVAALRRAAAADDAGTIQEVLEIIEARGEVVPQGAREQLTVVREALTGGAVSSASGAAVGLANELLGSDVFRDDQAVLATDFENVAEPLLWPIVLPVPSPAAAPPDTALQWQAVPAGELETASSPVAAEAESAADPAPLRLVALAHGDGVVAPYGLSSDGPRDVLAIDVDNDGRLDRVEAGEEGLRIVPSVEPGGGDDGESAVATLDASAVEGWAGGAARLWAVDLDLEGDLDLVLAPLDGGEVVTLRNDGDGGWAPFAPAPLAGLSAPRDLVWFDADGDGDGDLAAIDAEGRLRRLDNERTGVYAEREAVAAAGTDSTWLALAVADVGLAGRLSLLALREDGAVILFEAEREPRELVRWGGAPPPVEGAPSSALHWGDLDNNGAGDLVIGWGEATQVWLASEAGDLAPLDVRIDGRVDDVADVDGDGRLDMLGVGGVGGVEDAPDMSSPAGPALVWLNQGGELDYGWQALRLVAKTTGDVRNNSFGVGGEVALRTGLLLQARAIERPWLHFGLGDASADVFRVRWPNGAIQGEFDLARDARVAVEQRLVGSCPWLFAWDGEQMAFVTDILWRSPLGLRINAQTTAGVLMTRDRVKVAGEQLAARDGVYDLRVTAELWETHFFDHVGLTVVDHPADVEVWIDERFNVPPPPLEVQATGPVRPVVAAIGASGVDVSGLVAEWDGRTVSDFGLGRYQGVAGDHALEHVLDAPATDAEGVETEMGTGSGIGEPGGAGEVLIAQGWVYPTDSSINVALSQGAHVPPLPLSLEVPDASAEGGWRVAREGLGFPAGKHKTMLIDLEGLWPEGVERRLRLRTTMEIYWDRFAVAERRPEAELRLRELRPEVADLRYRGFSTTSHWPVPAVDDRGARTSPEIPVYEHLATRAPMWLDLAGRYTRFGDVGELLAEVDDRYVILNAGDEMAFRFPALEPVPAGWRRDFVFESDGWVKDGNFNTAYSATVLPLPAHDRPEYADQIVHGPVGELAQDPVYRANAEDWRRYHTREVRPIHFADVLRLPRGGDEAGGARRD